MDPRGRWEARYVKNAFQRDSSWELESILGPSEFKENPFPKSREQTLGVDLIVMAADGLASMNESQVRWISDFVEELGGGLILIDSGRDAKQDSEAKLDSTGKNKVDWLPVQYTEETAPLPVSGLKLEEAAIEQRAFAFEQDAAANRQLWEAFPAPRIARRVKPAPGSEVMVSGKSESGNYPMIVSRRSGQGRVVYLSNDETWRWRYNVADLYHQRFWNQLGQWTMQPPFAIENDYVALDSGDRTYEFGRDIMLRAKLRDTDRAALSKARAIAVIERDGQRIDSVPLSEDVEGSGIYSSLAKGLEPGRYQVRIEVPGLPSEALDMKTEFLIHPPQDIEREILAANRPLLARNS